MTEIAVHMLSKPTIDSGEVVRYLRGVGAESWIERRIGRPAGEVLTEFAGRLCYRSWKPGLNPNVTRVREDIDDYLLNLLRQGHGSVLEHVNVSFVLSGVSRVLTHELVRHRAGVAVSQESMRYVRVDEGIPFWFPQWAREDEELMERTGAMLESMEELQDWLTAHFELDKEGTPFSEKKHKTSFMRRFLPEGVGTSIMVTANLRAWRHIVEARTAEGAEEEIRYVAGLIGSKLRETYPALMSDYDEDWETPNEKV